MVLTSTAGSNELIHVCVGAGGNSTADSIQDFKRKIALDPKGPGSSSQVSAGPIQGFIRPDFDRGWRKESEQK